MAGDRAGRYVEIRLPVGDHPPEMLGGVSLQAVVMIDSAGAAFTWIENGESALVAFVALARTLAIDPSAPAHVRRVAAGVYAALGVDVPTDPGLS